MLVNQENLIKAGYTQFNNMLNQHNSTYLTSYQKRIEDNKGIKYSITIEFFDLKKLKENLNVQFESHVQFTLKNGFTFNINGLNDKKITISELESFYEKIYNNMDCEYYELK